MNRFIGSVDSNMVKIPAGKVELRDNRIKKQLQVLIKPFLLAKYVVTMKLYDAIADNKPSLLKDKNKPIVNILWNDAIMFCNVLSKKAGLIEYYSISDGGQIVSCNLDSNGYRLPSEAEWQYACKAGTTGYIYGELKEIASYNENSDGRIQEVGKKNRMHGACMIC